MIGSLLRRRIVGFVVAVLGALLLAAGAWRWVRPVPGPPEGASLDDFERVLTLTTSPGAAPSTSNALPVRPDVMHRVVVQGSLVFSTTGETLDGDLLVTGDTPGLPRLRLGRGAAHLVGVARPGRWVFTLPDGVADGGRLEVKLDTDPVVERFLLTPSEARDALHGELTVELWTRLAPARGPIAAAPLWFPGGFLLALGIALSVLSGRIRALERSPALALLDQIERRIAALRSAIDPSDLGAASLLSGLDRAGVEAKALAESIVKRTALLREMGEDSPTADVQALRGAIGEAGRALQAIDAGVAEAHAHARSREVVEAARDVEQTVARGLEARARLGRQLESLREADSELDRLEGRPRTTD